MPTLLITRGYPGSGKTTWAREWVRELPDVRVRVNRDDLRASLFGGSGVLAFVQEQAVTTAQHAAVQALLAAGKSVVVDDTNLRLKFARTWADLAAELGAEFEVRDFELTAEDCIGRDDHRASMGGRLVGEEAIRSMAAKFPLGRWPEVKASASVLVEATRKYAGTPGKPRAWIVDIDGTLANHQGVRDPYDTSRYHLDVVDTVIAQLVHTLQQDGTEIVVTSGRSDDFREVTDKWLTENEIWYDRLVMRASGDNRRDDVVKEDLFWTHIAPDFDVVGCIDDRNRVVQKWRAMGLTCLQVADGDF